MKNARKKMQGTVNGVEQILFVLRQAIETNFSAVYQLTPPPRPLAHVLMCYAVLCCAAH